MELILLIGSLLQGEIDRVHLRNGHYLDGFVVNETAKHVELHVERGIIFIRKDQIDPVRKVEKIKVRPTAKKTTKPEVKKPDKNGTKPNTNDTKDPKNTDRVIPKETSQKVDALLREMADIKDDQKGEIVDKISKLGEDAGIYLARNLDKIENQVLSWVLNAIVKINTPSVAEEMIKKLQTDNTRVKQVILSALSMMKYKEAAAHIRGVLKKDKSGEVKVAAINALLNMGSTESTPEIIEMFKDKDLSVRKSASYAVIKFANDFGMKDQISARILDIIDSFSEKEKSEIAHVLGEIGSANAGEKLIELISSDVDETRANSIIAIGKIKEKRAIIPLAQRLTDEKTQWVKIQIAWALEQIKEKEVVPILIQMLLDPNNQVRAGAARSLVHLVPSETKNGENYDAWLEWWKNQQK